MKKIHMIILSGLVIASLQANAQLGKLKGLTGKKDTSQTSSDKVKNEGGGPNLWNKAISKLAKVAGSVGGGLMGMVATTSDLNSVNAGVNYMSNLHPASVGVIGQSFFGGWEPGGNAVMLSFTSKNSIQFNKIDGTVTIDGKPANYAAMGVYSSFLKDNSSPKKVEISTTSGQKASFTVNPPKQSIKVASINGQKENVSVDLTKDVVIEFENSPADNKTPILVWLTGNTIGLKTFYEVGWFAPSNKITIPAAMFRNMNGVANNLNFSNAYLQVSRTSIDKATDVSGPLTNVEYANMVTDGKFINVTAKPVFNKGIAAKGVEKAASGNDVEYEIKKANALFSPSFSTIKNLGVMAFAVQGTTTFYDVKENKFLEVETTKEAEFPKFSNEVWQSIMDKMYPEIMQILKDEFNATILSVEKITNTNAYKEVVAYEKLAKSSRPDFSHGYKDTKLLLGLRPLAEMGGFKSPEYKIMKETGANALLKMTINLDINFEGAKALMISKLLFELNGEVIGDTYNTAYLTGTVSGKPYVIKNKQPISNEMLEKEVLKRADLIAGFKKGIQEIKAKEKQNGDYDIEWASMNK